MPTEVPYATPWRVSRIEDCHFYHTMDVPGHGTVAGAWDLRAGIGAYLGGIDFAGLRVLEIGPASGLLTLEMERQGGEVVAIEVPSDPGWDFVPFPGEILAAEFAPRRQVMRRLKNSFWFTRSASNAASKVVYADVYDLPEHIGHFDIAVMCAVLLHTKAPLQVIEQCANRTNRILITDMYFPDLEGSPVCRFHPSAENRSWDLWWHFSTDFFRQFLEVLGFEHVRTSTHTHLLDGRPYEFFSIEGRRAVPA